MIEASMGSLLRDRAGASAEMLVIFGDPALLRAALRFEAALATAQAAEGLIPAAAARRIEALCDDPDIDIPQLAEAAAHAGTLAIPLVARLRDRAVDDAMYIHLGATSQDLADTALMLQAKMAVAVLRRDLANLAENLAALAERHAALPMAGRTLLQSARPITLGLKAANWTLAIDAALARLRREAAAALAMQLGGAAGTRAGMAGRGAAVAVRMAALLDLACPLLPWHSRRDGIAGVAAALAIVTGALGKIARDVSLLAQGEVAEAFEPAEPGRGGSSAMPHKRNPTGCQVALSAALRAPGLATTIFAGMPQEHERGLGGWQAETPVLAELFCLAHGATLAMLPVIEGLEIDPARMRHNLAGSGIGDDTGESAAMVAAMLAGRNGPGEASLEN